MNDFYQKLYFANNLFRQNNQPDIVLKIPKLFCQPQDYLEKIIQVPLKLPVLIEQDVTCYMYLLFAQRLLGSSREKEFLSLCKRANDNRRKRDLPEPMNYGIPTNSFAVQHEPVRKKILPFDFLSTDQPVLLVIAYTVRKNGKRLCWRSSLGPGQQEETIVLMNSNSLCKEI